MHLTWNDETSVLRPKMRAVSDMVASSTYSTQRTAYHTAHSTEHNIIQTYSKNNIIQTYSVLKTTEYAYTSRIMASKQP